MCWWVAHTASRPGTVFSLVLPPFAFGIPFSFFRVFAADVLPTDTGPEKPACGLSDGLVWVNGKLLKWPLAASTACMQQAPLGLELACSNRPAVLDPVLHICDPLVLIDLYYFCCRLLTHVGLLAKGKIIIEIITYIY